MKYRDVPGSSVVMTWPSNAGGEVLIPGQQAKIPRDSRPKTQKVKQKQYCNKFKIVLKKYNNEIQKTFPLQENSRPAFPYCCCSVVSDSVTARTTAH